MRTAHAGAGKGNVRFINMYFIGYVVLVIGVVLGLWRAGVLDRVAPAWIGIGLVVAIGLGMMMAVGSGKPTITHD